MTADEIVKCINYSSNYCLNVIEVAGLLGSAIAKISFMSKAEKDALITYICGVQYGLEPEASAALKLLIETVYGEDQGE